MCLTGPPELQAEHSHFKSLCDSVEEYISVIRLCVKMAPTVLDLTKVLFLTYVLVPVFSN